MSTDVLRELDRVVDRLRSMPLQRLSAAAPLAHATCQRILDLVGDRHPLPRLADHAAGDQLAVVARTALEASPTHADAIAGELTELRRALP